MKKRRVKKSLIVIALILLFAIGGAVGSYFMFFKDKNSNDTNEVSGEEKEEEKEVEVPKLKIIDEDSTSRPFAVMINNHGTARKYHSGLQDSYINYEMIVEGGMTRFMAVFKDQDTAKIGSVRSSRHYYLDYALENDAYYVHWGWSPQAQSDIRTLGINNINGLTYEGVYFFRDKTLKIDLEHTGFTSMELLNKAVEKLKYRNTTNKDTLLNYSIDEVDNSAIPNVIPANSISIKYSSSMTTSYTYDATNKVYLRSVNGAEHKDYVTGKQYTAKNIITYQVYNSTILGDVKGRQTFSNIGTGTGYYITDGVAIPIKWQKDSRSSQTKYMYEDGTEIKVNDGNTWIQIQPKGLALTIA